MTSHIHRPLRRLVATVAAVAVVMATAPISAQPVVTPPGGAAADPAEDLQLYSCKKAQGSFAVTLKPETELKDLLTWAMTFTCKNFIYESSLLQRSKKLTIIAPNRMSAQAAYRLFLVSMSTMGLAVVPKGNVLRVVEAANAKGETVPIFSKGSPANDDDVVRLLLRPQHISVDELTNALGVVKSQIGVIQPVPKAGVLVITDYGSHIRDMITMVRELDQPVSGQGIYTIQVKYADVAMLAQKLSEILGTTGGAMSAPSAGVMNNPRTAGMEKAPPAEDVADAAPTKILADERTNSLILLSSEAGYLRVRALVERLDVMVEGGDTGSIHVYRLENAQAEELATTLNAALTGAAPQASGGRGARGGAAATPARTATPAPIQTADGVGGASFEGTVRITHDAPTNSLVVLSSGRDFQALKSVVHELDIPRRQVFIEAVILELNVSNGLDLGASFHGGLPVGSNEDALAFGGVQSKDLSSLNLSTLASATGLIGGLIGPILPQSQELLGKSIPSYAVLFQALAKSSNVNVLSSPHILTTNNEEAEISIGQNIPYVGGINFGLPTGTGGAGGFGNFGNVSIQRQELELSMKITPAINASDMVRLKIEQQIQDIGERDPDLGPTWTKRKIKTSVVVRDQQSIVIGGLISDRVSYSESKVPFLGDIPIFGYLFKYTRREKKKTNLLLLLTPYVIHDQLDLQGIIERKVRERNEFLRAFHNLDKAAILPRVDYRRKRGLIEEINRAIIAAEEEREELKRLDKRQGSVPEGPVIYELKGAGAGLEDAAPATQPSSESPSSDAKAKPSVTPTTEAPTTEAPTTEDGAESTQGSGKKKAGPVKKPGRTKRPASGAKK